MTKVGRCFFFQKSSVFSLVSVFHPGRTKLGNSWFDSCFWKKSYLFDPETWRKSSFRLHTIFLRIENGPRSRCFVMGSNVSSITMLFGETK